MYFSHFAYVWGGSYPAVKVSAYSAREEWFKGFPKAYEIDL